MAAVVPKKPTSSDQIVDKTQQTALEQLVTSIIQAQLESIVKPIRIQVNSVFDVMDTMQQSVDFSMKQINMRINAISGTVKKEREKSEWIQTNSLEDAISLIEKTNPEKAKGLRDSLSPTHIRPTPGPGKRV